MIDPDDKAAFLAQTACDDLQAERIRRRVREELDRMRALRATARGATEVRTSTVHRVRRRLVEGPLPARRAPTFRWAFVLLAATAVLAAFLVGRHPVRGGALATGDVSLELDGLGTVGGTPQAPEIRWETGSLRVAVTPQRNVQLAVVTPEATVRVVGTEFTVDRADFATTVDVTHGTVELTCAGKEPARVSAPGNQRCLPADAPTLLRRVSALRRDGGSAELRMEAIDAGLAAAPSDSLLSAELLAHRADLLATNGRRSEAMDAAAAGLRIGGPRRSEMIELLVGLAPSGCEAGPQLEQVVAADPGSRWGVRLAACLVERDPERARAVLDAVRQPAELGPVADEVRARLGAER